MRKFPLPITATLELGCCYVCETSMSKIHRHHIIPRAYGGVNGPTVTLCSSHHNLIHDAALACYTQGGQIVYNNTHGLTDSQVSRFVYLVNVIVNARVAYTQAKTGNRIKAISFVPTKENYEFLTSIKSSLEEESGCKMSMNDVINHLISQVNL